jgi:hypothetical protein
MPLIPAAREMEKEAHGLRPVKIKSTRLHLKNKYSKNSYVRDGVPTKPVTLSSHPSKMKNK